MSRNKIISPVSGKEVTAIINTSAQPTGQKTKAEIEALIARYKISNPVKYAAKEARGEFKKLLDSAI